jgi:hypothetical protein
MTVAAIRTSKGFLILNINAFVFHYSNIPPFVLCVTSSANEVQAGKNVFPTSG